MRIIGGHDYYDGCMAFGQEKDVVFIRNSHEDHTETIDHYTIPHFSVYYGDKSVVYYCNSFTWKNVTYNFKPINVLLCAKIYKGVMVTYHSFYDGIKQKCFWEYDEFVNFFESLGFTVKSFSQNWLKKTSLQEYFTPSLVTGNTFNYLIENQIINGMYNFERYYKHESHWVINCDNLKSVEFYKVFDSYSIYQEMSMWASGVLPRNSNKMVEITDDKIKIHKHGFDKYSFRTPKKVKK